METRLTRREIDRDDLKSVLTKAAPQLNVGLLLESLAQTAEFEREMSRKYSMPVSCLRPVAKRLKELTRHLLQFDSIAALSAVRSGRPGPATAISVVFEPYLGVFVDAQDK